jgi:hypothetical protein
MWQKLLFDLSFAWSKLWPPLLAASLVGGINYLLRRRDEKRDLRKRLSAEVYIPVRRQLAEAETAIRVFQRALSINTEMWKTLGTTGTSEKLNQSIKAQLKVLYENTLPGHDKAWQDLNIEIGRVGAEWDAKYADVETHVQARQLHKNAVTVNWWNFLTPDAPVTPVEGLREGDVLRLWNGFMSPARFKLLDLSVEKFLIQRWEEMGRNDFMHCYRDYRQRALAQIPKAISCLSREALY